jgi:hypothetical protein
MEILKALFLGMLLTLLTLTLAMSFAVVFVFAIGRLVTAVERAIKQRRNKKISRRQPDRPSSGSIVAF